MRRRRLLWKIYPSYLLITVLSLVAVSWYAEREFRRLYHDRMVGTLTARAKLFAGILDETGALADPTRVDLLCKELGCRASVQLTVIRPDGKVIGDTEHDPASMDNHSYRLEVQMALREGMGWQVRRGETFGQRIMYVAIATTREGRPNAVVLASMSLDSFESALVTMRSRVAVGGLVIVLFAAAVGWLVSRRITRPLEQLRRGVRQFTRGEFDRRLHLPDSEEMAVLAESMNEMAANLGARMATIIEQKNELDAVFDAMTEGVLVVDRDERVLHMNRAAETILGVTQSVAKGRFIQAVARNTDLQVFLRSALGDEGQVEGDIAWHGGEDRFFQARATMLRDADGVKRGVLVVLNEVTRLYGLERVRRDFVANVSHEMQTPITSIYGYAETLLDKEARTDELTEKAAHAIVRQAARLAALVDDLLELSRIEKQAEARDIPLARGSIREVLEAAVETCRTTAAERGVGIELLCPPDFEGNINAELLERAVVNLLDNATKYSASGASVSLECEAGDREIRVRVRDRG
ncbi:MAG TPA: histidine kinase dimerization/phospho-acceptor domain-containing protein, partial [Phycisphaerae bacterium]|nr:histidine kinase dimerization/phospho-acceptor domain-containing protein [Phycisphaerae bacterium]